MKKIATYIAAASLGLLMTGCNDFLDLKPQGSENSENYFTQSSNAISAVNGIYDILTFDCGFGPEGDWIGNHQDFYIGDILSDDAEKGSEKGDYTEFRDLVGWNMSSGTPMAHDFWLHGFWGVSRANYVIDRLPSATWDSKLRDRLMGEALFLRAYNYWYLVRIFGGVPLFTSSVKPSDFGSAKRASVHEVYAQIASDLLKAAELLPERSQYAAADMGRATKGAAKSLLARIYMFQIGTDKENTKVTWQNIYDLTNEVIKSGEYSLVANYAKLVETENDNSSESVFEIQCGLGSEKDAPKSIGTNWYQMQMNRGDESGWGFNNPTKELVDTYNSTDPRLSCIIYGETYNDGILYGKKKKYKREGQGTDWLNRKAALPEKPAIATAADRNIKVIRYADVLLMHAEAAYYLSKPGEAQDMVNKIRARARNSSYCMGYSSGKMDYSAAPATVNLPDIKSTGEPLLQDIWKERRLELAMEQVRFYDLVRTGRFMDAMDAQKDKGRAGVAADSKTDYRYENIKANALKHSYEGPNGNMVPVLPIPKSEVQSWGLTQNPGYN